MPPPCSPPGEDDHHRLGEFVQVNGELVGIPPVLVITPVGINRTQHAHVGGALQFVFERVPGQGRVVHLDVNFEVLVQPVGPEEAGNRLHVEVVLVLVGSIGLGSIKKVPL